jgi:D-glycero-D-manno-heptose 1,7-bisphosphate phosphatase
MSNPNKAVFLDRDGVINKTVFKMGKPRAPYTLEEFVFMDGIIEAVKTFKANGFLIVVVTNQPDVSRGWVSMEQVTEVNDYVKKHLAVDDMVCCFHTDKDNCQCRKPRPGMLIDSAKKWQIDLSQSFMVGDRLSDIEAGQAAGCKSLLLGKPDVEDSSIVPDHQCYHLNEVVKHIC